MKTMLINGKMVYYIMHKGFKIPLVGLSDQELKNDIKFLFNKK